MAERRVGRPGGESRELTMEMVQTLLAVIEEKDPHLRQHCERVANTCAHFCEKFSILPPKDIDAVCFATLLHDLGLVFGPPELSPHSEDLNAKEVFAQILQKFASGKIVPPVMPKVVQNLQDVINKPNATADMLSAVIEREPVISLRLVSISNSPVYRGMKEIRNIRAVSLHEKNEFDSGVSQDCLIVNLANMVTRMIGYSIMETATIEPAELRSASLLGMAPETVVKVAEETKGFVKELAHLF